MEQRLFQDRLFICCCPVNIAKLLIGSYMFTGKFLFLKFGHKMLFMSRL